jgi:hypothetical protein
LPLGRRELAILRQLDAQNDVIFFIEIDEIERGEGSRDGHALEAG